MTYDWYKRDVTAAIKGMVKLTLEERGAYNSLIDYQYLMNGSLKDDDTYISGLLGCDIRIWKRIKAVLIDQKKIATNDGLIGDIRAAYTIAEREALRTKRVASGQLGGISSGISRKNKALKKANGSTAPNQTRGEEKIEDSLPPKKSEGEDEFFEKEEPPRTIYQGLTDIVWQTGVPALEKLGVESNKARGFLGQKLKHHHAKEVIEAIDSAVKCGTGDPFGYITGVLRSKDDGIVRVGGDEIIGGQRIREV